MKFLYHVSRIRVSCLKITSEQLSIFIVVDPPLPSNAKVISYVMNRLSLLRVHIHFDYTSIDFGER